jgi:LytTr DNA-binding domain
MPVRRITSGRSRVLPAANFSSGIERPHIRCYRVERANVSYRLMTMSHALSLLPSGRFLRIHRSYIVSVENVRSVASRPLDVADKTLPIGRTYRKEAMNRLAALRRE